MPSANNKAGATGLQAELFLKSTMFPNILGGLLLQEAPTADNKQVYFNLLSFLVSTLSSMGVGKQEEPDRQGAGDQAPGLQCSNTVIDEPERYK